MKFIFILVIVLSPIFSMAQENLFYLKLRTLINGQTFKSKDLIVRDGYPLRINQVINGVDTHISVTARINQGNDRSIFLSMAVTTQDQKGKKTLSKPRLATLLDGTEANFVQKSKDGKIETGVWVSAVRL